MLCRALLAAVVLSCTLSRGNTRAPTLDYIKDVLCVLLLSGVQKEDIDAGTLRKLERHNVNIDDINDQELRKQCLGKTNIPVTLLTQDPVTEKATTEKSVTTKDISIVKRIRPQAEDRSKLRKIFEFLEYDRKGKKNKAFKLEDNKPILRPPLSSKKQTKYYVSSRNPNKNFEDSNSETSELRGTSVTDNNKEHEKSNKAIVNKKLKSLMNIWQTDIDKITNAIQESTTVKSNKEDTVFKNTKDVEYITKIIEEIMTKKKINDLMASNTEQKPAHYDSNATLREVDQTPTNKTIASTNYFLNNCKLGTFYAKTQGDEDKYEIVNNDQQFDSGVDLPVTKEKNKDDFIICKKGKEKKMQTDLIHGNVLDNILKTLNQKNEHFKLSDNDSSILNQSESSIHNKQSDQIKTNDNNKEDVVLLDPETAKALEVALQTQSNIYNQIFIRQRDLAQMSKSDQDRITQLENERRQELQSALIEHPPAFHYKPSPQDDDLENKKDNMWRYADLHTIRNQMQNVEHRENNVINNSEGNNIEKSTDNMEYDPKLGKQYKRPWFYSEGRSGRSRIKNKENLHGIFFTPNDKKLSNTEPRAKNTNGKKWSPYFDILDKNSTNVASGGIARLKNQKPIPVDSYRFIQLNNKEISKEFTDNNKKQSNFVGLYENNNISPNIGDVRSGEQYVNIKENKISQSRCEAIHETRIQCLPNTGYTNDREYFRNKQIENPKRIIKARNEESEYFNYQFPSRPRTTKTRYEEYIVENDYVHRNETTNSVKSPTFSQNVIKDIANSIKEIVFKDFIITTVTNPTTTTPSTTTSTSTTTTGPTTTTTPKTTITTTITTTTMKSTEGTSTAETKQPLKIQDASITLEKIMEMFEKIRSIKNKFVKHENVTHREDDRYDSKMESKTQNMQNRQEQPAQQQSENRLAYNPQPLQPNLDNQSPYVPQIFQPNPEKREPYQQQPLQYIPQSLQIKPNNSVPYVLPAMQIRGAITHPLQGNLESGTPNFPSAIQLLAGNRLPYDAQNLQRNSENLIPYYPSALQQKAENRIPYAQHSVPIKSEIRTSYEPQTSQLKSERGNNLPYDPQTSLSKLENRASYYPAGIQMRAENRIPYLSQAVQIKTENNVRHDSQTVQSNPENLTPYFPQGVQSRAENRVSYNSLPLQRSPENRVPYETQPLQSNLGNRIPYDPQPLQTNPENSVSYVPQPLQYAPNDVQLKPENGVPYDAPSQRNQKTPYSIKNSYYNSKIELDPYQEKVVLEPVKQKPKPRKYAITVQTNSGEIAPLKITVRKPLVQTIVLTTKSPEKVEQHSEKTFNDRKFKSISTRRPDENPKESEISNNRDNGKYFSRNTHRDAYIEHQKSRKIKKEHDVPEQHRSRNLQEIGRFHEKLERGDNWNQYEDERIPKRMQRPIVKNTNYDDTHFRNFLQTQQKVNAMLERILATSKNKPISTEVV